VRPVADLTSTASHTGTRHCVECLEIDLALRTTCETLKTLARVFAIVGISASGGSAFTSRPMPCA
jgi:hypothetical protein